LLAHTFYLTFLVAVIYEGSYKWHEL
jgi:hypothetical protein